MSLENFNQSEKKDFLVSSASLKDVRAFSSLKVIMMAKLEQILNLE